MRLLAKTNSLADSGAPRCAAFGSANAAKIGDRQMQAIATELENPLATEFAITTTVKELRRILPHLGRAIKGAARVPILECVNFEIDRETITVSATDLDMYMQIKVAGECNTFGGNCILPLKSLRAALKGARPADPVYLSVNDGKAYLQVNHVTTKIDAFDRADFPELVTIPDDAEHVAKFTIDTVTVFGDVAAAMSNEETRFYLNGAAVQSRDGDMLVVATDGHRLNIRETHIAYSGEDVIIPRGSILAAIALAKNAASTYFAITPERIVFEDEGWTLTTKTIDGTFPEWRRVMPDVSMRSGDVDLIVQDFRPGIEALATVKEHAAEFDLSRHVMTSTGEKVKAEFPFTASVNEIFQKFPMRFGLDAAYMRDAIASFPDTATVNLAIWDEKSPMLLTCEAKPELRIVLMPVRINNV